VDVHTSCAFVCWWEPVNLATLVCVRGRAHTDKHTRRDDVVAHLKGTVACWGFAFARCGICNSRLD